MLHSKYQNQHSINQAMNYSENIASIVMCLALQADYYASVWAMYANGTDKFLEMGDIKKCDTFSTATI